jgi:hypothetical protein
MRSHHAAAHEAADLSLCIRWAAIMGRMAVAAQERLLVSAGRAALGWRTSIKL